MIASLKFAAILMLPFLAWLAMAGCAFNRPTKCWSYSWGEICKGSENYVHKYCTPENTVWDNGKPRPRWAAVSGCTEKYKEASLDSRRPIIKHRIMVPDTCSGAESLTHEMAHADGVLDPEQEGYNWNE